MFKLASVVGSLVLVAFAADALSSAHPAPSAPVPFLRAGTVCVQDQYGNQYSFTVDPPHAYLHGTVANAQGCVGTTWPLSGSYVETPGGLLVELTAANPIDGFPCVAVYKLKGLWPNFAWYYETGYASQESSYVPCGSRVTADPTSGGTLGP